MKSWKTWFNKAALKFNEYKNRETERKIIIIIQIRFMFVFVVGKSLWGGVWGKRAAFAAGVANLSLMP